MFGDTTWHQGYSRSKNGPNSLSGGSLSILLEYLQDWRLVPRSQVKPGIDYILPENLIIILRELKFLFRKFCCCNQMPGGSWRGEVPGVLQEGELQDLLYKIRWRYLVFITFPSIKHFWLKLNIFRGSCSERLCNQRSSVLCGMWKPSEQVEIRRVLLLQLQLL